MNGIAGSGHQPVLLDLDRFHLPEGTRPGVVGPGSQRMQDVGGRVGDRRLHFGLHPSVKLLDHGCRLQQRC